MGECVKSCCYCCASCFQPGICFGSLCCLLVPLLGLLTVVFGALFALIAGLAWLLQHHTEPVVGRMLAALTANISLNGTVTSTDVDDDDYYYGQLIAE